MNKNFIIILISILAIATSCSDDVINNSSAQYQSNNVELFDSITTQQSWSKMTMKQKLTSCQIPENKLGELSTQELIELCAKHPLNPVCNAYDNPMDGAKVVMNSFNGFNELRKRKDAAGKLLDFYEGLDFSAYIKSPYPITIPGLNGKLYSGSNITFMELLLASDEISELYEPSNVERMKAISLRKIHQKFSANDVFGKTSISPTLMVQSQIAIKTSSLNKDDEAKITNFINNGGNVEDINSIITTLIK